MTTANPATTPYDVYLLAGATALPDLGDLVFRFPLLGTASTQRLLLQRTEMPGYLGLDLPFTDAVALLARLRTQGAAGQVAPSAYRQPRISVDDALLLAQPVLMQREAGRFARYQFGPVMVWREDVRWWVIGAVSEQLLNEGHIPGGVSTAVDKIDGHIWTLDDMSALGSQDLP